MTPDDKRAIYDRGTSDEDVAKTHPGFIVTCGGCGSSRVIVHDERGWSKESGRWGGVMLWCLKCGREAVIADPGDEYAED